MKKFLQKIIVGAAGAFFLFGASPAFSQATPVVDENFQSWSYDGYGGNDPGSVGDNTNTSDCEVSSANTFDPITKNVTVGSVTYTITEGSVAPQCYERGGTSTTCVKECSRGYVMITNTTTAAFATSEFPLIDSVTVGVSNTGGSRTALLQKSTDGGTTWTDVQTLIPDNTNPTCSAYGYLIENIEINETDVSLRIVPDPNNPQRVRIHDLKIYGTAPTLSTQAASWAESGISVVGANSNLTFTSDLHSGSVDIIDLTGAVIATKDLNRGGQTSIPVSTGLYIVRFVSDNKMFTKKVFVN